LTGAPDTGRRPVRIGLQLAQYAAPWPALLSAAREAEAIGVDAIFNWDHFFGPGEHSDAGHLECWTMLAAWAQATSQITLGPLVSSIGYRNPDLVADMARTIDHVSGGRFVLGLGAGFKQLDYDEYGFAFGTAAERAADLADGLVRIRRRLARLVPPPVRPIPILVGGSGERRTLPIVAEHADIWHTFEEGESFIRKSAILDERCRSIGRDPVQIERSVLVTGDPERVGSPLREAGATLFIVSIASRPEIDLAPVRDWLRWRDGA
jgi:probable F420-dependent oxidoreductase